MVRDSDGEADVERLLQVSADGPYRLADLLDACVEHLRAVESARAALRHLPPEQVRAAITRRRHLLGDGDKP
ncbi:hypothetical protein DV701_07630 [Ornithinimicrobium avium]|jgi:hypothetical protein|uniref:Uncharacterized protein n=1 Tax=Ornithinimicrobium avium TaxID=2283195 RepID=A0A345NLV6_9MICO|nr:hypothetical protein DV701_07630 [Ornithinimicrobium avium]